MTPSLRNHTSPAWSSQVLALALYQRCGCDCIRRICQLNVTSPRWSDSGPPLRLSHTDRDRSCAPYPQLMTFTRWDKTERTTPNLILKMLSHDSLQTLHEHKYQLIPTLCAVWMLLFTKCNFERQFNGNSSLTKITFFCFIWKPIYATE